MATINQFEEIKVWQKSRDLCKDIFNLTQTGNFSKDFGLKDQINRSSGSIMDNISEGFGRKGNVEFINFLTYASGSACETKSQIYRAFDRNYISIEKKDKLMALADEIGKMITSLITYLGSSDFRGTKFKGRDKKVP